MLVATFSLRGSLHKARERTATPNAKNKDSNEIVSMDCL